MDFSVPLENLRWERFAGLLLERSASGRIGWSIRFRVKWKQETVHKRSSELGGEGAAGGGDD